MDRVIDVGFENCYLLSLKLGIMINELLRILVWNLIYWFHSKKEIGNLISGVIWAKVRSHGSLLMRNYYCYYYYFKSLMNSLKKVLEFKSR